MAIHFKIDISAEISESLADLQDGLRDQVGLHARIAGDSERWVKGADVAGKISAEQHRSAETLGAAPTGHLAEAYEGIESTSDNLSATLLIPGASRLRAAFGDYEIIPKKPNGFLTIPVAKDSYGKRAGEFGDEIFFALVGPKRQPVLARRQERVETESIQNRSPKGKRHDNKKPLEVLYILTRKSKIKEARSLIPFDKLEEIAALAASDFINDAVEGGLA